MVHIRFGDIDLSAEIIVLFRFLILRLRAMDQVVLHLLISPDQSGCMGHTLDSDNQIY